MPLTDVKIRKAKPEAKTRRLFDGRGLYLEVSPAGGKWWRFKYRFADKEKRLSLGTYPDVSLQEAREARDKLRKLVVQGKDPAVERKVQKVGSGTTFKEIAEEWIALRTNPGSETRWSEGHRQTVEDRLKNNIYPWIGDRPIKSISASEILTCLRRIEARGSFETAHRVLSICRDVYEYALAVGRAEANVAAPLKKALVPYSKKKLPALVQPAEITPLLRAIRKYRGSFVTRCALQLTALTFLRQGELRHSEWSWIDFDERLWRLPEHIMKNRKKQIVPLATQTESLLRELQALTGQHKYIFSGARSAERPMSENTVTGALARLGYKDEMVAHGFRSTASTILNEHGWNSDAIERQLAHVEVNKVRGAYNEAEYLPERRLFMQAWADYLDRLVADGPGDKGLDPQLHSPFRPMDLSKYQTG